MGLIATWRQDIREIWIRLSFSAPALSKELEKTATRVDRDAKVIIPYRQSGTLRTAVFLCGAILGRSGRQVVLHLSPAWGGLETETTSHTTCV